jgi:hypothetical protein
MDKKGKGISKNSSENPTEIYDTRERLPAFHIGTPLGDQILSAIVRHYPNDPMV